MKKVHKVILAAAGGAVILVMGRLWLAGDLGIHVIWGIVLAPLGLMLASELLMRLRMKTIRIGVAVMAVAVVFQLITSFNISSYTYGITTDPAQGLLVAMPMFIGALAALISPVIGGIFAGIINIPGFFVSWIGVGGDPWMANRAFSEATFVNVAIYYVGLVWYISMTQKAKREAGRDKQTGDGQSEKGS